MGELLLVIDSKGSYIYINKLAEKYFSQETYLQTTTVPVFDNKGDVDIIVSIATDVTWHIKHSKIIQRQKEELETIVENMSEGLAVIDKIGMIKQNTFRQLRLVNNLLDITRADAGRIKINKKNINIVFLTKAITESVYNYASSKGVKLTFTSSSKKKVIGNVFY